MDSKNLLPPTTPTVDKTSKYAVKPSFSPPYGYGLISAIIKGNINLTLLRSSYFLYCHYITYCTYTTIPLGDIQTYYHIARFKLT